VTDPLRILGQELRPETLQGLREAGFAVDEVPAGPVDAVLLECASDAGPDLSSLAMLRLEHPDALLLLASPSPHPRRLIEWVRAGLDDWVDAADGTDGVSRTIRASVQRRQVARQQREVMVSLEDRRQRAATEERELSDRLIAAATELESEHQRLGDAHSALQNRVAQLVMLYRIGRNLSSHRNWDEALSELLEQMKRFLACDGVALLLRSQGGRRLAARSVAGLESGQVEEFVERLEPLAVEPAIEETLFPLESLGDGPLTACADRRAPFGTTVVPLVHRGRDLGCLVVAKDYADGVAFADDYYFLVTIRTVVAEEVASAQAVHELRRLQKFQERALAHLTTGILTLDGDARVGLANPMALELLGVPDAAQADVDRQIRLGAEAPPLRRWLAGLGDHGAGTVDAWVHRAGAGEAIPVSITVSALAGELPGEIQYVCMLEDGRQRQALEAERRRAARQKELLIMAAEWAHDVRTPLTGILHSAELLAGSAQGDRADRHFEVIRAEVQRINELVNHFLDYARPVQLRQQERFVDEIVRGCVDLMEGAAAARQCALEVDTGPVAARVDPDQLRQVLLNLITNAIDAAPGGSSIRVRADRARRDELGADTMVAAVEIEDAGSGVNPEDIDRLFVPFFTTKSEGTGLGLAISEKIIRAHGGTLRYERLDGRTIFRVVLPVLEGTGQPDEEPPPGLKARG
jgi:signal transduction histidine kinase